MTFIDTVPEEEATGAVAAMYDTDRQVFGHLPNLTKGLSLRPDVYAAWRQLNGAVKGNMDLRRYELATLAAARRLRSSYCALAHGSVLLDNDFLTAEGVRAVVGDQATGEGPAKRAVGGHGGCGGKDLTDTEILDVVLAASVRCFFSKTLDALGVKPDAKFAGLDPELRDALTVGRPIADG